ncbi:MAG: hypothetical protein LBC64_07255 [Fibromonadaceae bacterium]|jgi:hypothetical protein|nr:hypothetical protein [Fibromonadaceae bacterium]
MFAKAKNETSDTKYDRLNKILQDVKEGNQGQIPVVAVETLEASTNKYTKNSTDV